MRPRLMERLRPMVLTATALLAGCGTSAPTQRRGQGRYAQEVDTATSACLRNPACYAPAPGEQAILPWLSRAGDAARATTTVLRLLDAAQIARVDKVLKECAEQASFEVNERLLGEGKRPTRELCQEVVGKDSRGQPVTRAMELGREKHRVALECAQERLEQEVPDHFSLEPRYQYSLKTKQTRLLDPKQVDEWLRDGLLHKLLGTLVPDVVLHAAGKPLQVQAVYDFKFPCPSSNFPSWHDYPSNHPFHPRHQGNVYQEALGVEAPALVAPFHGVLR